MSLGVALESREFLSSCLKAALEDADLVDAISDQALEQGLSALTIGQGKVSVDQLKDKLYLTVEEAKSVLNICTSMVSGAVPSKSSDPDPLSLQLSATQSGSLALRFSYKQQQAGTQPAPAVAEQDTQEPAVPFEPLEMIMENAAVVVVSRATPYSSEKKILAASDSQPLPSPSPDPAPEPQIVQHAPVPAPDPAPPAPEAPVSRKEDTTEAAEGIASKPPAPKQSSIPKPAATTLKPEAKAVDAPAAAEPSAKPAIAATPKLTALPKPAATHRLSESTLLSTPKSATRPVAEPLSPEASAYSPRLSSSTSCPASSSPSYLRPTAAHKARISKDAESPNLAPVLEDSAEQRRRRTLFSRMASTLLAPTQAFVARVTGRSEEAKSKKDVALTKASLQLESMLLSPQGQRVTKPQPFMLRSEMRGKSVAMSTEELELAEAREKAFKRNPVPKHVHEPRPIAPVVRSTPKDPNAVFEPFQLASLELHHKKIEQMRKKIEEEEAREEEARRFKARAFDARIATSPVTPPKPAPSPVTKAAAPVFASEARISHYHEVIEPAKKAKEEAANREKLEAERKARELEEMGLDDFRKTLEFKARPMPDFSSPFRVDPSLSRAVTSPTEPKLHTVQRLGAVVTREDKEGPGLGNGVYDGDGYVDPFFASLRRKSTSVSMARVSVSKGSTTPSSARVSTVRQSASVSFNRGAQSARGPRGSVGSSIQAAIRAAARDAARDLEVAKQLEDVNEEAVGTAQDLEAARQLEDDHEESVATARDLEAAKELEDVDEKAVATAN